MDGTQIVKRQLENGLTVVLREVHQAPVASFWLWYRVGSRNEVPGRTGASHWVEHMLFKGTPTFPKGTIDRLISREGGVSNAMTWIDWTTYFATLPADRIELALRIEADRMVNALFDPDEVEAERTVIISERQGSENNPRFRLAEAIQAIAFRVHPYHHMVIGDMADLKTMSRDDLYRHYRAYYVPNNAVAVAVGDFDGEAMLGQIEALFGSIPPGPVPPPPQREEPPPDGERRVILQGEGTTAYVDLSIRAPRALDPDYFPMIVLDAVMVGSGGLGMGGTTTNHTTRLYRRLVEGELATAVYGGITPTLDPYLGGYGATVRTGHTPEEVEAAIWAEIERVKQEPISEEEFAKALKQARAQFAYSSESVTSQARWLGFAEMMDSYGWFFTYLDRLAQVTAEDVRRVAQTYFDRRNLIVGWYVPEERRDDGR